MSAIAFSGFFIFLSFYFSFAVDQTEGPLDNNLKRLFALSPMTAIKNTIDCWNHFHMQGVPTTFDNWGVNDGYNWSLQDGALLSTVNFVCYLVLAVIVDVSIATYRGCRWACFTRKVIFVPTNTNEGKIEVLNMQERGRKDAPVYCFSVEKSHICCLIGTDSA